MHTIDEGVSRSTIHEELTHMARSQNHGVRRPATKLPNLQKKIAKARIDLPKRPQKGKGNER